MTSYHMPFDEFRRHGHELIDWIADYLETIAERPIMPDVKPGEIRASLPGRAPEQPEPFEQVLRDLDAIIAPGLTNWQSPGWFGYFPANSSPSSILGELVSAGLAQQGMLWSTSPATTELEMVVVDWMADLLGLPGAWKTTGSGGGVIQMSASDSTHLAFVVARDRAPGPNDAKVAYASDQSNSSIEKGARIAGFRHVRLIPHDERFALDVTALRRAIETDVADGLVPAAVVSNIGTTGTTAVDPVRAVGEIAAEHELWHHVDAAYAGTAMICPEFRHHQDGVELADSYTVNPHKWMFTNFDCNLFYVADRAPLIETTSILPPYLRNTASDEVIDYRDWHVPLGRRFRALKLWFVLRTYGAEGIRHHVREHHRLALELTERIEAHPSLELFAPTPFGLVTFTHVDGNDATQRIADAINDSGWAFVTPSTIDDRRFVRVSIGQTYTTAEHVDRLWELIAASV
jgi:aromatic-L-amino-acid/L-tryptophan decarboxylase